MKKVFTFLLVGFLLLGIVGCSPSTKTDGVKVVGFVTDIGGLGDLAYNDAVYSGATEAATKFGFEVKVIESKDIGEYADNMRALINDGAEVIMCAGAAFVDAVTMVAGENPDTEFLIFDANVEGLANVSVSLFREQEAAFLLGALAGLTTKTNNVGYIGGVESPLQERAMRAFEAGFWYVNKTGKVVTVYAGTYGDPGKGKGIATSMYSQGADFVATWAGACNVGVFQAAGEAGEGKYAFGAALGQFGLNPTKIVASQVKTIDKTVFEALSSVAGGNFTAGSVFRGIKEGGVDLKYNPDAAVVDAVVTEAMKEAISKLRDEVISGAVVVPSNKEELANFIK